MRRLLSTCTRTGGTSSRPPWPWGRPSCSASSLSPAIGRQGSSGPRVALIVASALWLLARYIKWLTTNFVVTSDRVVFRHGVFAKSGIEIPLERINSVHFTQTIIERILGAGDLMIESGSEQGQQRFSDVRNPDRVTKVIHEQMDINEDATLRRGYAAAAPSTDVATQLEKLEGMRDRGTLSPEEFEAQKRKLLG